ncbi:Protein of unknown function [Pyronema omphalodes CBS 100304]|uniref:Uncharacterized protein n=1 Tax=Pyronema omphalodes (strain CBS 100304) TaxID=1076935 RepID=U4KYA3_PYROM|nr:Protein of unknown function [Pyronema omphalodes CBS 100304]
MPYILCTEARNPSETQIKAELGGYAFEARLLW